MTPLKMNADAALAFVERHGIVLVSAKGPAPRLTGTATSPVNPSRAAGGATEQESSYLRRPSETRATLPDVLVCRFHRGARDLGAPAPCWPALVKLADQFPARPACPKVRQEHTASGQACEPSLTAYPTWVPAETLTAAQRLPAQEAETLLKGFIGSSPNRDIR